MKTVSEVMQHKMSLQRERLESEGLSGGEVYSITPIASVFEAIQMMSDHHVGALPVMIEGKLVGIVSERDYARKVILKDKSSKTTRVSEIMTRDVITVSTKDHMSDCVDLMSSHHVPPPGGRRRRRGHGHAVAARPVHGDHRRAVRDHRPARRLHTRRSLTAASAATAPTPGTPRPSSRGRGRIANPRARHAQADRERGP